MQDVVAMSGTEHAQLARYIHGTWSDGVGAMPLSLYLFKKLNYLRQARDMAKGAKKISFSTRLFLFFLLFSIVNGLSLKKFNRESSAIDKKIAHYLVRWRKLVAKKNT